MPQLLDNLLTPYRPANPFRQPCFAVWTDYAASQGGFSTFDHNLNCIGRYIYNNSTSRNSQMSSTAAPELFDTWTNTQHNQTQFVISTNSNTCKGTSAVGYLGNMAISMGDGYTGDVTGTTGYNTYRAAAFRDCGTIVNETDQRYAVWWQNQQMIIGPRSANWYGWNNAALNAQRITVTNKQAGFASTKYGTSSYNAKTNKLCVLETNGSYTWRPTVYSNVPRLINYVENPYSYMADQAAARDQYTGSDLYTYFNTAANYSTSYVQWTGKPTNSTSEDNQRLIAVMCDNDKIVTFQQIPSYGAWVHRWAANGTAEGSIRNMSWTTSYGVEQGTQFGARWCVSSDGRYIMAYCPSYYYNCGYMAALIRVSDGKMLWDQQNDSSYGYQFHPIGVSSFMVYRDPNTDGGAGCYEQWIDADHMMLTNADNAQVNFGRSNLTQLRGGNWYSTDYPARVPLIYDTKLFTTI